MVTPDEGAAGRPSADAARSPAQPGRISRATAAACSKP